MKRIVLLPIFLLLVLTSCMTDLYHDMSEEQANEMVHLLRQDKINAEKNLDQDAEGRMWMVSVPKSQFGQSLVSLTRHGVPQVKHTRFGDMFGEPGLISNASQEKARFINALAGEISTTLQSLEGVIEARVMLVVPDQDPVWTSDPGQENTRPSASVLMKTESESIPVITDLDVQRLVAASVQNLDPSDVVVIRSGAHSSPVDLVAQSQPPERSTIRQPRVRLILILALCLLGTVSIMLVIVSIALYRIRQASETSDHDQNPMPVE